MARSIRKLHPRSASEVKDDIFSGITVAIVALPLAIGFGITSGMTATAGISTAIIAGFLAALFGGSRYQVSGPTGAMAVILVPVIHQHGISAIPVLGIFSAAFLLIFASLRLGTLIKKVPEEVVEGFTIGIAILIALQQLPFALGTTRGKGERILEVSWNTLQDSFHSGIHWYSVLIVIVTLLIKFNIVKFLETFHINHYFPASFSALTIATILTKILHIDSPTIGEIPRNFLHIESIPFSRHSLNSLLLPSISIALLAAIEALLAARVADEMANTKQGDEFRPNQELMGQAIATLGSSLFGGMPSTGAIARTSVNVRSHAKSRLAAMTHAIFLLLIALFLAPIFSAIPTAAIAGILIGTSLRIFNRASLRELRTYSRSHFLIFLITAIFTISVDLISGIASGLFLHALLSTVARSRNKS